jgi:hypothetical protein
MAFYARPNNLLSPGDIFRELPVGSILHPLRVIRKSDYNPPAARGPQDLRRAYKFPEETESLKVKIRSPEGESLIATGRIVSAMLLTWGSQIEEDLRNFERSGKAQGKLWLVAPIYPLAQIPESQTTEDVETGEKISVREIIIENRSHLYLYLPQFPETSEPLGHYLDLRKMTTLPINYFVEAQHSRIVGLHHDGLNMLYSRLMWFFTRAEYFFHPVLCQHCGTAVELDLRFEGQNVDAEPWE